MTLFALSYLAGALTIFSPCILPVIPFVLARSGQPFLRSVLPMLAGLAIAFATVATLAGIGGAWVAHANIVGRWAALAMLAVFGASLLSTRLADFLSRPAVRLGDRLSATAETRGSSVVGSLLLGVATGLLWTPCAGPILGLVLTGAALKGPGLETALLLASYGAGAATALAGAILAGRRILTHAGRGLRFGEGARRIAGGAVLAGVAVIASGLDSTLLARVPNQGAARLEAALVDSYRKSARPADDRPRLDAAHSPFRSSLPVEGEAPSLEGAVAWRNSSPLTAADLKGKVVLIEFWTYSCINCIRTLPYVRDWYAKYRDQGLVVIGVHSPEFAFERSIPNVENAIKDLDVKFPVAIDNDFTIWKAFENQYWPAQYLVDAEGNVRRRHFGEGEYAETEQAIRDLLSEARGKSESGPSQPATVRRADASK